MPSRELSPLLIVGVDDCASVPDIRDVDQARAIMQDHRHYCGSSCLQRKTACDYLRDEGEYRPDSSRAGRGKA